MFKSMCTTALAVGASTATLLLVAAPGAQAISGGQVVSAATYKAKDQWVMHIGVTTTNPDTNKKESWRCVGALVQPDKVALPANCLVGIAKLSDIQVIGGRRDLTGHDGTVMTPSGQNYSQGYGYTTNGHPLNDMGVLYLPKAMPYKPVKLVPSNFDYNAQVNHTAHIYGWGVTKDGASRGDGAPPYSPQLRTATPTMVADSDCKKLYPDDFDAKSMFCAGPKKQDGADYCYGDTGAPLTFTVGKEELLGGFASWGVGNCGNPKNPSVYSRVTTFNILNW